MRVIPSIIVLMFLATSCQGPAGLGATPLPERAPSWRNLAPVTDVGEMGPLQPLRWNPYAVAITRDGSRALVTLRGSEIAPTDQVLVIDVARAAITHRLTVGARPTAVRIRPDGASAVVLSSLSPYAAVIDLRGEPAVIGRIEVGYYAEDLVFTSDGRMLVTSRMNDTVEEWRIDGAMPEKGRTAPAGVNPSQIALSSDGRKAYVSDAGNLAVRVYDTRSIEEIASIRFDAPIADIATMGSWIVVTTLNETFGFPCEEDADYPGAQGDGVFDTITDRTCSRGFADIQNEVAFIDSEHDLIAVRYTSDSAEISEADREGDHDPALMRVVGALPHSIAVVSDTHAWVTMGASFEVAEMRIDETEPPVPPSMDMPRTIAAGYAPRGVASTADGAKLVVANNLGESVSILDTATGERTDIAVDPDPAAPPFPATDAEIGELFFFSSLFSTDGDQSCSHCHPDADNDGKQWGVPVVRAFGRRSTMVMKNLADTRPLLIEGVFDEKDFRLEMEGISFRPDYHDSSYTLQVQRRDQHYREVSRQVYGFEIPFDDMVLRVADFLVVEPRLLPSPFDRNSPEAQRGRALFFRPDVGCANCHQEPSFSSPELFGQVTTPALFDGTGDSLDPDVSTKFLENSRHGFFNANGLRGAWDRRGSFFHDGRARTLRETILTPGHQCLREGERAFNEFMGRVDTNGGVSHLTCDQIDDLIAFIVTL